nr:hypothetical protein [Solirubrobacterales bacterium]
MRALRLLLPTVVVLTLAPPSAAGAAVRQADWGFGGIGDSQRTVRIIVPGGTGCGASLAPPIVEETDRSVRITARIAFPDVADPRPCPAILIFAPQFVTLEAPLAGRTLLGANPRQVSGPRRVARVVGLSPGDAITVLRARGIEPKVVRRRKS